MTAAVHTDDATLDGFRHEALLYSGVEDLVDTLVPFVREGLVRREPVMVAMPADRNVALQAALGADADRVEFVDMFAIGGNPARIIPEWRRFVEDAGSRPARGIGEPIWVGRREVEVSECVLHESLLNMAFDDGPAWQLWCPYDVDALPASTVEEALRTHPAAARATGGGVVYLGHDYARSAFTGDLVDPVGDVDELHFAFGDLAGLRDVVRRLSRQAGVGRDAAEDLVLAAHELATNSISHGGGAGVLRAWTEPGAFVVEVRDSGTIEDPLVGRELSAALSETGRGVWMANQLCDLVQVRSTTTRTAVRLFTWLSGQPRG